VTLFLTVLEVAAPVFLIAAIGFGWVRAGYDYPVEFVTRLGVLLATPCLIFTALVETEIDPSALADLSLATLAVYAAITLACWALIKGAKLDRRTFLAPVIFGNTGNLGLPLVLFAFGETGLGYGVVVFGIMSVWAFTFGIWLVSGGIALSRLAREPMVVATVAGAIFLWQGWGLPAVAANTLGLIGQMAIPLMLLTLGVAVAQLKPAGLGRAVWLSLAKVIVCAGLAYGVGSLFPLDPVALAVLTLQAATPVAVTSYLLAERYKADAKSVAGLVVVSTLMSVGAIPLLLALLL
jgi:predicted permease